MREAGNGKKPAATAVDGDISAEQTECLRGFWETGWQEAQAQEDRYTVAVSAPNKRLL